MTDQPDRPDGDGLREMNERAKRHAVRWGASAGCFDMLAEFARGEIERATPPTHDGAEGAGPRDVLRSICKAGGDLGCSCADRNYQWFDQGCKDCIAKAYKKLLAAAPPKSAPDAMREALITECVRFAERLIDQKGRTAEWHAAANGLPQAIAALSAAPVPPANGPTEIVLEECENLTGDIIQTVHLADGKEIVRSALLPTIDKTKLYTVLSKSIPADMIDGIWQELNQ